MVRILDKQFVPFISKERIQQRIIELAKEIDNDYRDLNPLFIAILNGSFIFAADFFRSLTIDAEISFVKLASYSGMESTGTVMQAIGLEQNINSRHVIILEDIVDSGKTLSSFLPELQKDKPRSIKVLALLTKPAALKYGITADYTGFEIPDKFVVGYGLDYDGYGRNLPELYILADQ